jgi:hypothetical protein
MAKTAVSKHRAARPFKAKAVHGRRGEEKEGAAKAGSIHERTMLVALTVRRWHIGRNDPTADVDISKKFGVNPEMGKYRKLLVRKEAISTLRQLESKLRETHYGITLPWADDGYRILSSKGFFAYQEKISAAIEEYNTAADELVTQYKALKKDAKERLGQLYNEADYPSAEELRACYEAKVSVRPLPNAEDFRVDLGSETDVAVIRQQIDAELKAQVEEAHRSLYRRVAEVLEHASERLKAYSVDPEGRVSHPFRESLIGNIKELLSIIPILNVTEDEELVKLAARIEAEVVNQPVDVLRDSDAAREKVIASADSILKKMSSFLA